MVLHITSAKIEGYPAQCLLQAVPIPIKTYKKSVVPHLLNAAKGLIPVY